MGHQVGWREKADVLVKAFMHLISATYNGAINRNRCVGHSAHAPWVSKLDPCGGIHARIWWGSTSRFWTPRILTPPGSYRSLTWPSEAPTPITPTPITPTPTRSERSESGSGTRTLTSLLTSFRTFSPQMK